LWWLAVGRRRKKRIYVEKFTAANFLKEVEEKIIDTVVKRALRQPTTTTTISFPFTHNTIPILLFFWHF
jgi:hypothetical protein